MSGTTTATDRRRDRRNEKISVITLYIAGFYFLVAPVLLPGVLGWNTLAENFGAQKLLCIAIGFQFLYIGVLTRDKYHLRRVSGETLEALNQFLFGADYKRHREAVDILIKGLSTSDPRARRSAIKTLERMTGQKFGEDQEAWTEWWIANRGRFRVQPGSVPGSEDAGPQGQPPAGGVQSGA